MLVRASVVLFGSLLGLMVSGCNHKEKDHSARGRTAAATTSTAAGGSSSSAPASSASRTPAAPAAPAASTPPPASTPSQGSRFWYENDVLGQPLKRHSASEAAIAAELLTLHNAERAKAGLPALAIDDGAYKAAKAHAEDMVGRAYFDHVTPEGWTPKTRLTMLGTTGQKGEGENIILGYKTAAEMTAGWMASPGHRANILEPTFTHVGFGVAEKSGPHAVAVFLSR